MNEQLNPLSHEFMQLSSTHRVLCPAQAGKTAYMMVLHAHATREVLKVRLRLGKLSGLQVWCLKGDHWGRTPTRLRGPQTAVTHRF